MSNYPDPLKTQYTVILGAEGELGKAIAREIARKGCNLILVSTTSLDLQRFAIGLQLKEDVRVDAFKLDLSDLESVHSLAGSIRERGEIRALINNITCDWSVTHRKCISELSENDFLTRFRGAVQLTWELLPIMKGLSSSFIQHIIPFPFRKEQFTADMQQSVSKMYAFARELKEQLRDSTVAVSMVHPAPVRSLIPQMEPVDGLSDEMVAMTPRIIAVKAVNGMLRGDRLIIPGFWNRIQFYLNRQATSWFRSAGASFGSNLQPSV